MKAYSASLYKLFPVTLPVRLDLNLVLIWLYCAVEVTGAHSADKRRFESHLIFLLRSFICISERMASIKIVDAVQELMAKNGSLGSLGPIFVAM